MTSSNLAATAARSADVPESDLIARCRRGDVDAFEEVYRRHAGRLFGLACRMLGSASDAEDLLQEIFLLAYRKLDGFKGESTLGTWLYRLGTNACLDYLRSRSSRMRRSTDSFDADDGPAMPATGVGGPALSVDRMDLERAIGKLPEGCRAAFLLHDVEGFEHQEVAAILGIAEGTSKSQVHKARMRLRGMLREAAR